MFINPIQFNSIGRIGDIQEQNKKNQQGAGVQGAGFQDIFKNTWNIAQDNQQDLVEKQYLQSIGEIDDTHTLPIAQTNAELSLSLLVGLRNKAMDAYNELMRINV